MNLVAFQEDPEQIKETLGMNIYYLLDRINEDEKVIRQLKIKR